MHHHHTKKTIFALQIFKTIVVNHYETMLIVTPVLTESEASQMAKRYEEYLADQEAELVHRENWGLKQLAYPIDKKTTGIYVLMEYKAKPEVIDKFEVGLQRDEKVMRFLTVKLNKYGVEYAAKRRDKLANPEKYEEKVEEQPKEQEQPEVTPVEDKTPENPEIKAEETEKEEKSI